MHQSRGILQFHVFFGPRIDVDAMWNYRDRVSCYAMATRSDPGESTSPWKIGGLGKNSAKNNGIFFMKDAENSWKFKVYQCKSYFLVKFNQYNIQEILSLGTDVLFWFNVICRSSMFKSGPIETWCMAQDYIIASCSSLRRRLERSQRPEQVQQMLQEVWGQKVARESWFFIFSSGYSI